MEADEIEKVTYVFSNHAGENSNLRQENCALNWRHLLHQAQPSSFDGASRTTFSIAAVTAT
jgi:hypothetical protein